MFIAFGIWTLYSLRKVGRRMPFREIIARLALRDACRFERRNAEMLRRILSGCRDDATRA